jgi:hypothetical protein
MEERANADAGRLQRSFGGRVEDQAFALSAVAGPNRGLSLATICGHQNLKLHPKVVRAARGFSIPGVAASFAHLLPDRRGWGKSPLKADRPRGPRKFCEDLK